MPQGLETLGVFGLKSSERASVIGRNEQGEWGKPGQGDESEEVTVRVGGRSCRGLAATGRTLAFTPGEVGAMEDSKQRRVMTGLVLTGALRSLRGGLTWGGEGRVDGSHGGFRAKEGGDCVGPGR